MLGRQRNQMKLPASVAVVLYDLLFFFDLPVSVLRCTPVHVPAVGRSIVGQWGFNSILPARLHVRPVGRTCKWADEVKNITHPKHSTFHFPRARTRPPQRVRGHAHRVTHRPSPAPSPTRSTGPSPGLALGRSPSRDLAPSPGRALGRAPNLDLSPSLGLGLGVGAEDDVGLSRAVHSCFEWQPRPILCALTHAL